MSPSWRRGRRLHSPDGADHLPELQEVLRPTFDEAGLDAGRREAFTVGLCGAVSELLAHWVLHPDGQPPVDVLVTHVVELTTAVLRLPG